jgi:hypothetical protein
VRGGWPRLLISLASPTERVPRSSRTLRRACPERSRRGGRDAAGSIPVPAHEKGKHFRPINRFSFALCLFCHFCARSNRNICTYIPEHCTYNFCSFPQNAKIGPRGFTRCNSPRLLDLGWFIHTSQCVHNKLHKCSSWNIRTNVPAGTPKQKPAGWPRLLISLASAVRRVPSSFAFFAKGRVVRMPAPAKLCRPTTERNLPPAFIHAHRPGFVQEIETITAPPPLLRCADQASLHWIAMHIPKLLYALLRSPHVEVVGARLPERSALRLVSKQIGLPRVPPLAFR